ncbi:hypothetical protein E4U32_000107 [Claviceps aff. humidiphila group G2b]|nr:hypothetical protein E4U32_000107 [Claviceps aff. humidiphila group G2b]
MLFSILLLFLVALATAEAVVEANFDKDRHYYPRTDISKTFRLVVQILHFGLTHQTNKARIFYQNGTDTEPGDGVSNILTDHDFPLYPVGLTLTPEGSSLTVRTAHLIDGPGDRGLSISMNREGGDFPHWTDHFVSLRHITKINEGNGTIIPPDCIRVLLTPECYASSREWMKEAGSQIFPGYAIINATRL